MTYRIASLFALSAIVALSAGLVLHSSPQATAAKKQLTLDLLYDPELKIDLDGTPPRIVRWLKDGESYVEVKSGEDDAREFLRVDARSGDSRPLLDLGLIRKSFAALEGISDEKAEELAGKGDFEFSPDEDAVMIEHDGDLFYFRFADEAALRLTDTPVEEKEPAFSPDGKMIAYIRDFDLYVADLQTGEEKRLTFGGGEELLNGLLDWVYQEEIYGRGDFKGYWWSPDSSRIAYLQLDESPVPRFTVVDHIPVHLKTEVTRYPKAGDPNPNPRLAVVSAQGGDPLWLDLSQYEPKDLLIVKVSWTPDSGKVVFQTQNKEQTWLDLNFSSVETGRVDRLFRETTPAWVNVLDDPHWLADGSFLWRSERTGWSHLYRYAADGSLLGAVTAGEWEVRRFHCADEGTGRIYFTGTERSPIGEDVYRIGLNGDGLERISDRPGTHRARFNDPCTLYVDSWSDLRTPTQTRVHEASGRQVRVVDANPAEELAEYLLSGPELVQVETRDGFLMEALLIKPADFDPSRKYPVMSHTYGGPHAPRVRNRWMGTDYLWHQMLAQKGYVIWICDNRTASGKGAVSAWPVHRNMGELELQDLEDGLTWLKGHSWVDGSRIGLGGWSYGGYMTAYALTHSQSFRIGIVGAPVADWSLYDTVYTERYMGTPQSNPEGYKKSSPLKAAADLHGKMLLLHGAIDDNVHLQNSVKFIYELQKAGKQFQMMIYPKSRHGVRQPLLLKHLRTKMTRFIIENL